MAVINSSHPPMSEGRLRSLRVSLSLYPDFLCGVSDDFELSLLVYSIHHRLHAVHDCVFDQVLAAIFALQNWQFFENDD